MWQLKVEKLQGFQECWRKFWWVFHQALQWILAYRGDGKKTLAARKSLLDIFSSPDVSKFLARNIKDHINSKHPDTKRRWWWWWWWWWWVRCQGAKSWITWPKSLENSPILCLKNGFPILTYRDQFSSGLFLALNLGRHTQKSPNVSFERWAIWKIKHATHPMVGKIVSIQNGAG